MDFALTEQQQLIRTQVRHLARELGLERHFLFTGFLRGEDIEALYRAADVFVMPSVSEPFGLVSIEAAGRNVPVIVSKQSGAAEVLEHALKVDFWNVEELASRIISVLRDPMLAAELAERGGFQVRQMRWSDAAEAAVRLAAGRGQRDLGLVVPVRLEMRRIEIERTRDVDDGFHFDEP